jgi:hypothetical protein
MTKNVLKALQVAGLDAYMRTPNDSWVIFTDGFNLGYAQEDSRGYVRISTMHKPHMNIGSGFKLADIPDLSESNLKKAFQFAPVWAKERDVAFVRKWNSIDEYINSNPFNKDYKLVNHNSNKEES